jgi:hypothetical protein
MRRERRRIFGWLIVYLRKSRFQYITITTNGGSYEIPRSFVNLGLYHVIHAVRRVSRSVVCVVRRALLGHGLVHITSKVGSYLFYGYAPHRCRDSSTSLLGDPSGGCDPQNDTPVDCYPTYHPQVHFGSSRRRRRKKISQRGTDKGDVSVPSVIRYLYNHDGIMVSSEWML